MLSQSFTKGNGYFHREADSLINVVKKAMEDLSSKELKIAAFHYEDWKKALKWLIDNAE